MDTYKHFIRVDSNNIVIHGFSSAFEEVQPGDIQLSGDYGRHFNIELTNEKCQFVYKIENGSMVYRTQAELTTEWNARPTPPPTVEQQLSDLQDVVNVLLMGGM